MLTCPQVISRTVSVKSPDRVSSVISHFTPADHRYEATGSVLIEKGSDEAPRPNLGTYSPPAASGPAKPAAPRGPARPAAKASGAALTRTVKVRTPVRVPTVISHFVPADHRYEAEGSVTIVKGSAAAARASSSSSSAGAGAQFTSRPAPPREVKVVRKISRPAQSFSSSSSSSADKLALTRTVSVKTPERIPSVISHFVPADHRYEATGSVTIRKGSQSSSKVASSSSSSQAKFVSGPAPAPRARPAPAPAPAPKRPIAAPRRKVTTSQSSSSSSAADKLALTRTVSVKSPERVPSVISHFVPADHRYEATGSVTIVRGSQGAARASASGSSASKTQSAKRPAAPTPAPAPAAPRRVEVTRKVSRPAQSSSSSASDLALTRTVSVKSPKRVPKVISHFVPAEHQYEATGSVTIVRGSESSSRKVSGASSSRAAAASTSKVALPSPAPPRAASRPAPRVEVVRKQITNMKPPDLSLSLKEAANQVPVRGYQAAMRHLVPDEDHRSLPSVRRLEAHRDKHQEAGQPLDKVVVDPLLPLHRLARLLVAKLHSVPLSHLQAGASQAAGAAHLAHQAKAPAAEFPLVPVRVRPLVSLVKLQEVEADFQAVKAHLVLLKRHPLPAQAGKIILRQGSKHHLQALPAQALVHRHHQHLLSSSKHQRQLSDRHKLKLSAGLKQKLSAVQKQNLSAEQKHLSAVQKQKLSAVQKQKLSAVPNHLLQLQLLPLHETYPLKNPTATNLQNHTEAAAQSVLLNSLLNLKASEKTQQGLE
ncbi:hypothetical protein E2C01_036782 [Portunus trituberculatus]|uniref:Uncharacterized protein n=1 Tax=Portunus trituberculatus TaxID=210409 RepID=A0A5B7FCA7_PORTR|nr:hypothetical protein [Portunus trituberculatus]